MNTDHADAVALYAEKLLGRHGAGWRMAGIDPDGLDLRRPMEAGGETARLDFDRPVLTPAQARTVLVELAQAARKAGSN
jgi:putative heme iron utilization protein